MPDEQLLIADLRDTMEYISPEEITILCDTEIGRGRYEKARAQYDLECRFSGIRKSTLALSGLIKDSAYWNEMYINEFWDRERDLTAIFEKLQGLEYEKSFPAMYCPLIDEIEYQEARNGGVDRANTEAEKEKREAADKEDGPDGERQDEPGVLPLVAEQMSKGGGGQCKQ